jgi:hypothetical protein
MALKKSELYSSLWSSCDELRGGMDASQYKDYVLVLLFIKYVSDKYAGVIFLELPEREGSGRIRDVITGLERKPRGERGPQEAHRNRRCGRNDRHPFEFPLHKSDLEMTNW